MNGSTHFASVQVDGVLLVDKPLGLTSHDVVARLRRIVGTRRIGHTGTLDPLATGLLVVCLGLATRIAQYLTGLDKVYLGAMTLGAISSTYDAEGEITAQERELPAEDELREVMEAQIGERVQLPPPFSAVKVAGKKLYEYARAGEIAPPKPRMVRILKFDLLRYKPPVAEFAAHVGSGTYVRSMAHDCGLALGCGAYLSALRRTRVGAFAAEDAVTLDELQADPALLQSRLLSISEALVHFPKITLLPTAERTVLHGGAFSTADILEFEGTLRAGQPMLVLDEAGRVLSIAQGEAFAASEAQNLQNENAVGAVAVADWLHSPPLIFKPLRVLAQR